MWDESGLVDKATGVGWRWGMLKREEDAYVKYQLWNLFSLIKRFSKKLTNQTWKNSRTFSK